MEFRGSTHLILSNISIIDKPRSTHASAWFCAGSGGNPATQ